jgi:hypothetical protein
MSAKRLAIPIIRANRKAKLAMLAAGVDILMVIAGFGAHLDGFASF